MKKKAIENIYDAILSQKKVNSSITVRKNQTKANWQCLIEQDRDGHYIMTK